MKTKKVKSILTEKDIIFSQKDISKFPIVGVGSSAGGLEAVSETERKSIGNLNKIIILLREQTGHDFSLYKKSAMFHRIEKRMGIHQIDKIQKYVHFLQENTDEVNTLFKELLIGVTSFFRDILAWKMLKENVLPALMNELPDGHVLRAWVPACSSGEEVYSLAIVFREVLENLPFHKKLKLQIFATDLNSEATKKARNGRFSKKIAADVSPERLSRFFTEEFKGYRVNTALREMVMFAPHNVIKDPPFTKLDFISCRNMLIYMEPELQQKLIAMFNKCLNPGGVLLLGSTETVGTQNEGFEDLDAKLKIFKRLANVVAPELIDFPSSFSHAGALLTENKIPPKIDDNIQSLADQILLQHYAPASMLVNDKGDILYISGRTGKYLEPVSGKANWNIYTMVRDGLRQALTGSFRKAMQNFNSVVIRNIIVGTNGSNQFVDITVQRIENPESIKGLILVIFSDVTSMVEYDMANPKTGKRSSTGRLKEMEIQLQGSFEEIQNIREEMKTSQEELKTTNEELQSTKEELESTNVELTLSKEEMQNLNEELQKVNIKLQSKVTDYTRANEDMKNILNCTEIATLILDKELNIRKFSDQLTKIFKLRNADIGRPVTDLATDLQYSEIDSHSRQVIKTLKSVETAAVTSDGRWFNIRNMPYRTLDDRVEGLVMTFTDITVVKRLEKELKEANEALRESKESLFNITHLKQ